MYNCENQDIHVHTAGQGLSDHEYSYWPFCFMTVIDRVLWAWDYESRQAPLGGMYRLIHRTCIICKLLHSRGVRWSATFVLTSRYTTQDCIQVFSLWYYPAGYLAANTAMCPGTCMHNMLMLFIVTLTFIQTRQYAIIQGPGVQLKQTHLHTTNHIHHTRANHGTDSHGHNSTSWITR